MLQSLATLTGITALSLALIGCSSSRQSEPAAAEAGAAEEAPRMEQPAAMLSVDEEFSILPSDSASPADEGKGPDSSGDQYSKINDNPFRQVRDHPRSTFSVDVDTASYSKVRQYLVQYDQLPRPDAVRIEELLNYFQYDYAPPADEQAVPFATHLSVAECPWQPQHRLARIAIKGRIVGQDQRPDTNLVLLIDSSGSMDDAGKLPLLKQGMALLLQQLGSRDSVAIVTYAGSAGLVLDSTPADQSETILAALNRLDAGGSTNGGSGLNLAYQVARDRFIAGGTNRILLCTDGDFNVGQTGNDQLVRMVESNAKDGIELTVLGFGMGNLNDAMLEQISSNGNGNYAFIDTLSEAKKVLADQLSSTLMTIAKDVKLQVEFNPSKVAAYRLIGYENRMLATEDFNDDQKDAGEIGAGHSVTALYELVPTGVPLPANSTAADALKYQQTPQPSAAAESEELLTVKLRYKLPGEDESRLLENVVLDSGVSFEQTDTEFQFASAVAAFGMLLRQSPHGGDWTFDSVSEVAESSLGEDPHGLRREFVQLVATAQQLRQAETRSENSP